MKQWLTGDDLANMLGMLRVTDSRTFVVLEGASDCQALDPHVDATASATFPAHSKSVAKQALELVDLRGLARVLIILDRDFVGQIESVVTSPNVVYTDGYDLDATILFSGDVLDRVVSAHSDRTARTDHLNAVGVVALDLMVEMAGTIGLMRYISERDRLSVNCREFPLHQALNPDRDSLDIRQVAVIGIARSRKASVTADDLEALIVTERRSVTNMCWYCSGHDLATSLASLTSHWGGSASRRAIAQAIRSSLSCADLKATQLYAEVLAWAQNLGATVWNCA